jgi:hypothetical protein
VSIEDNMMKFTMSNLLSQVVVQKVLQKWGGTRYFMWSYKANAVYRLSLSIDIDVAGEIVSVLAPTYKELVVKRTSKRSSTVTIKPSDKVLFDIFLVVILY